MGAIVLARVICACEAGGGDVGRAWEPFALMKGMPWERQLAYDHDNDALLDESTTKKVRRACASQVRHLHATAAHHADGVGGAHPGAVHQGHL